MVEVIVTYQDILSHNSRITNYDNTNFADYLDRLC